MGFCDYNDFYLNKILWLTVSALAFFHIQFFEASRTVCVAEMPSGSFIRVFYCVFALSTGGLDSYYSVSPKEMKAKIIFATKNHWKKFISNYNRKKPQTLKSGHLWFLFQWLAAIYQSLMKNTKCCSIPVYDQASLCAPASLFMSVSVSLSVFPSLSLSFTLPLSFSREVRRFFFLEDRLWRNPGSFDFVTIQVCSYSCCIDKRGPMYLCSPNQSLSSSFWLTFVIIGA